MQEQDSKFTWRKEFGISNLKLDRQHEVIFEIAKQANQIAQKITTEHISLQDTEQLNALVKKMLELLKTHFRDEEEFMRDIDFPFFDEHRKAHQFLIQTFKGILAHSSDAAKFANEFSNFTKTWISTHFTTEDKWIDVYLNKAIHINEIHFSLESYIQLKSISNPEIEKEPHKDYICSCRLKIHKVPLSIHNELVSQNKDLKCQSCKQVLVYFDECQVINFKQAYQEIIKDMI